MASLNMQAGRHGRQEQSRKVCWLEVGRWSQSSLVPVSSQAGAAGIRGCGIHGTEQAGSYRLAAGPAVAAETAREEWSGDRQVGRQSWEKEGDGVKQQAHATHGYGEVARQVVCFGRAGSQMFMARGPTMAAGQAVVVTLYRSTGYVWRAVR